MKRLTAIILTLTYLTGFSQTDNSEFNWNEPSYKYVKVYLYGLLDEQTETIIFNNKLHKTVIDTNGITLTEQQIKKVISVVTGKNNGLQDNQNFCFIPHHGIVFYDHNDTPVAHISICFLCGLKKVTPETDDHEKGMNILAEVIKELGIPIFNQQEDYYEYLEKHIDKK